MQLLPKGQTEPGSVSSRAGFWLAWSVQLPRSVRNGDSDLHNVGHVFGGVFLMPCYTVQTLYHSGWKFYAEFLRNQMIVIYLIEN